MASNENSSKRKAIIALYIVSVLNILVSAERVVFDALGQMWVILFINGVTIIATLLCIFGVLFKRNTAIVAFIVCAIVALGVNIVIVLIFNDVGVFADKEDYLSLTLSDNHWWKDHGFLCYTVCNHGNSDAAGGGGDDGGGDGNGGGNDGGGGGEGGGGGSGGGMDLLMPIQSAGLASNGSAGNNGVNELVIQECFASYVVIETAHASVNMLLMVLTILLSLFALNLKKRRKARKLVPSEDDRSFRYLGIGRYGGNAPRRTGNQKQQPSFYKLSESFDTNSQE